MTGLPFTITCGDQPPRRAASLKGAKVTMGRMMNNVVKGTRGQILENDAVVLDAECTSLGWNVVLPVAGMSNDELRAHHAKLDEMMTGARGDHAALAEVRLRIAIEMDLVESTLAHRGDPMQFEEI